MPEYRTYSAAGIVNGERLGQRHFGEPSDRWGFMPANCLIGVSPVRHRGGDAGGSDQRDGRALLGVEGNITPVI